MFPISTFEPEILVVDDEQPVLDGIMRRLGSDYRIKTMNSPTEALGVIHSGVEFGVVLTDMQMPVMDGLEFVGQARAAMPETVFLMLTGQQDLPTVTRAINDGHVFRYFTKPCSSLDLRAGLNAAIKQNQLLTAERDLMQRTYAGSINIMTAIMGYAQPQLIAISEDVRKLVECIFANVGWRPSWEVATAAQLALVGFVRLSPSVFACQVNIGGSDVLSPTMYRESLATSESLVMQIPRLDTVAEMIRIMSTSAGEISPAFESGRLPTIQDVGTLLGVTLAYTLGLMRYGPGNAHIVVRRFYPRPSDALLNLLDTHWPMALKPSPFPS